MDTTRVAREGGGSDSASAPRQRMLALASRHRYALGVALVIALGAYVLLPSRNAGMITDDYIEVAMLDGVFAAERAALDLFTFSTGTPEDLTALQRLGSIPYWVHPEFKLSFLRPLSSALVLFDRHALSWNLPFCHLHSIVWWAALCAAVGMFYRALLPASTALWATAIFALSDAHHFAVTWLANRGGMVSMLFGLLGLHVLLLRPDMRTGRTMACALFTLSVLGGEWVFPLFGFALSYLVIVAGERTLGGIARHLWPLLVPAGLFLLARSALHYGAHGSGVYVDPVGDPLRFLTTLGSRAPILAGDVLLGVPAHWWDIGSPWRNELLRSGLIEPTLWRSLPSWRTVQVLLGIVAAALFAWLMIRVVRRATRVARSVHAALLTAALLSLLPVAASFPSSRLGLPALLYAAPGVASLMQWALRGLAYPAGRNRLRLATQAGTLAFALHRFLLAPVQTDIAAQAEYFQGVNEWVLTAEVDDRTLAQQHVILLGSGEFTSTFFFPYVLHANGRPMPRSSYPLLGGPQAVDIYRDSETSFLLRPVAGTLLETDAEIFFRQPEAVIRPGQRFVLDEMAVEVRKVWKERPLELRVTFKASLDDARYVFLRSMPLGLQQVILPAVGQWMRLAYAARPNYFVARRGQYERRIGPIPDFVYDNPFPFFLRYRAQCSPRQAKQHWKYWCGQVVVR